MAEQHGTKLCTLCKREFPETSEFFYRRNGYRNGFNSRCKACSNAVGRAWSLANRDKHNALRQRFNRKRTKEQRAAYRRQLRIDVLRAYSGGDPRCLLCGESAYEFLSLDHVDGGGSKHRRSVGQNIYNRLRANGYPAGFQVLCHNCNYRKFWRSIPPTKWPSQWRHGVHQRMLCIGHYSSGTNRCACCMDTDTQVLTIDHIDPVTSPDKESLAGTKLYR